MFDFGTFDQFTFDEDIPSAVIVSTGGGGDGWKKRKKHYEILLEEVVEAKFADERALNEADLSGPIIYLKSRIDRSEERIAEIKAAILRELEIFYLEEEEMLLMSEFSIFEKINNDDEDVLLLLT